MTSIGHAPVLAEAARAGVPRLAATRQAALGDKQHSATAVCSLFDILTAEPLREARARGDTRGGPKG